MRAITSPSKPNMAKLRVMEVLHDDREADTTNHIRIHVFSLDTISIYFTSTCLGFT